MENTAKNDDRINVFSRKRLPVVGNQQGMALIIALVMLAVLGMLGVLSLNTSTTELRIAGNYRNDNIAFYNSNMSEAYGPNNNDIEKLVSKDTSSLSTYPSGTVQYLPITTGLPSNALGQTSIRMQYLCVSGAPPGLPSDVKAFHYVVTIVGKGLNNAEYVTESEVVKLLPVEIETDC